MAIRVMLLALATTLAYSEGNRNEKKLTNAISTYIQLAACGDTSRLISYQPHYLLLLQSVNRKRCQPMVAAVITGKNKR